MRYYSASGARSGGSSPATGTSLVPEEGFTLDPGDRIDIDIEAIGRLSNTVTVV